MPLDTSMAELAARKVAEKVEDILLTGASSYNFGGGKLYGYLDFPHTNSISLTANWDASGASGTTILDDVLTMKQALITDRCYGPYILYVPTAYERVLDDDFKTNSDKTIRQRLLEIGNVEAVKVVDHLTANRPVLVQMSSDVVRLVNAMNITTVQWDSEGGLQTNFKVMAIQVPQIRADQNNRCGVVYGS